MDTFSCTCIDGVKKRWCEHRIGMLMKKDLVQVPDEAKFGVEIGKKRKRGQPKQSMRAREHNMMYLYVAIIIFLLLHLYVILY